jgi:hypothetical protein
MVVFMNEADMRVRGIAEGDMVELESLADDKRRVVGGFWVKAHGIAAGSIGAYYPETNPLLPLAFHDLKSGTPAAKSIPVLVRSQVPQPQPGVTMAAPNSLRAMPPPTQHVTREVPFEPTAGGWTTTAYHSADVTSS